MRPSAVFTQMTSELNRLTIAEASARLRRREISSRELTRACLDRVAAVEPRLNAFITLTAELNRLTIAEASARLRRREISSRELTRACLDRVAAVEPRLNAFITVTA